MFILGLSVLLGGCSDTLLGPKAQVKFSSKPYSVKNGFGKHTYRPQQRYGLSYGQSHGKASYYGGKFNGRKTSSCVIFDEKQLTAAHPTAVLPSIAKITRVDTGKHVYVVLTDRGPFAKNRICDLSVAAAGKLGFHREGHINVTIEILPAQSKLLAAHWKKFLHKKLPNKLFQHIHDSKALDRYLRSVR